MGAMGSSILKILKEPHFGDGMGCGAVRNGSELDCSLRLMLLAEINPDTHARVVGFRAPWLGSPRVVATTLCQVLNVQYSKATVQFGDGKLKL